MSVSKLAMNSIFEVDVLGTCPTPATLAIGLAVAIIPEEMITNVALKCLQHLANRSESAIKLLRHCIPDWDKKPSLDRVNADKFKKFLINSIQRGGVVELKFYESKNKGFAHTGAEIFLNGQSVSDLGYFPENSAIFYQPWRVGKEKIRLIDPLKGSKNLGTFLLSKAKVNRLFNILKEVKGSGYNTLNWGQFTNSSPSMNCRGFTSRVAEMFNRALACGLRSCELVLSR